MFEIIIASHGDLSVGMKGTLDLIVGKANENQLRTFTLRPGEDSDDFMKSVNKVAGEHPDKKYVVITDIFGGSVNNSALINLVEKNIFVVSGIIPAFVLELYLSQGDITEEFLNELLNKSKDSIKVISNVDVNVEEEDF